MSEELKKIRSEASKMARMEIMFFEPKLGELKAKILIALLVAVGDDTKKAKAIMDIFND